MQSPNLPLEAFARFQRSLDRPDLLSSLSDGLIGEDIAIPGIGGSHPLIYADYVASGRALRQVENFMMKEILPLYANSHTEASFCGQMMTRLRRKARQIILNLCGAGSAHTVIFTGAGATAGINRLIGLSGVEEHMRQNKRPLILLGPYEHHSNILPWRESGAEVTEIPEAPDGGPDREALESALKAGRGRLIVGAFSAASNVTGIVSDVPAVTRLLKSYGAFSIWDYAGGGPYLPIDVRSGTDSEIDAIVISPHKFIGGPGASGVMILRREAVKRHIPTLMGGGTVRFVSPWAHDYSEDVTEREEAGTPNVVGDIRAALCFIVKNAIGQNFISDRLEELRQKALQRWRQTPGLQILGNPKACHVLPIFSFKIADARGGYVHHQLFTRMLSDLYGIQARGGCACAGPYAHRLLGINHATSEGLRDMILKGEEVKKPGWTRLGFSPLMSDIKAEKIILAVDQLARDPYPLNVNYQVDERTARFSPEAA